eukprot:m.235665 g.235665  ORF g.235665 m.235665 type:complete len:306 (+) comp15762_c2_seq1:2556-3473(+)
MGDLVGRAHAESFLSVPRKEHSEGDLGRRRWWAGYQFGVHPGRFNRTSSIHWPANVLDEFRKVENFAVNSAFVSTFGNLACWAWVPTIFNVGHNTRLVGRRLAKRAFGSAIMPTPLLCARCVQRLVALTAHQKPVCSYVQGKYFQTDAALGFLIAEFANYVLSQLDISEKTFANLEHRHTRLAALTPIMFGLRWRWAVPGRTASLSLALKRPMTRQVPTRLNDVPVPPPVNDVEGVNTIGLTLYAHNLSIITANRVCIRHLPLMERNAYAIAPKTECDVRWVLAEATTTRKASTRRSIPRCLRSA